MDDLRWILLLVGGLVVVAVYFSSRFEKEDWVREREEFDARKRSAKKKRPKSVDRQQQVRKAVAAAASKLRTEPQTETRAEPRIEPVMEDSAVNVEDAKHASFSAEPVAADSIINEEMDQAQPEKQKAEEAKPEKNVETKVGEVAEETAPAQEPVPAPVFEPTEDDNLAEAERVDVSKAATTSSSSEIPKNVVLNEDAKSTLDEIKAEEDEQGTVPEPEEVALKKNAGVKAEAKAQPKPESKVEPTIETESAIEAELSASSIRPGIEDEITSVTIPADLAIAEAELHNEKQQRNKPKEKLVDELEPLPENIEPLVLVLTIMAEEEPFTGVAVKEALEAEGLQHGEMRIFHCFDENLDLEADDNISNLEEPISVFSVASLLEPGYFELDKLENMEVPGLTLFCQLPGPMSGEDAFNIMLDKGRGVAVRLHGELCDDKRNRFTTQAKKYYQDRIATYSRELSVAKKKAGA